MQERTGAEAEIRNILSTLRRNWAEQNEDSYTSFFSDDTDWQNAFNVRLQGRENLKAFLRDYVWRSQSGRQYSTVMYRTQFIADTLVLAEYLVESTPAAESADRKRLVHTLHLLAKRDDGQWKVTLTRIWDPLQNPGSLKERFPYIGEGQSSGMKELV